MASVFFLTCFILAGCGTWRYYPEPPRDHYAALPRWPLNRMPTPHEEDTYHIYKDNPKKLARWYRELKERHNAK